MSTLKEKFNQNIITNIDIRDSENRMYYEYNHLEVAEQCEKIADDYAMDILRGYISNKTLQFQQSQGFHSLEQLLLIIKKEKGYV